jgi:hypothetical protein
MSREVATRKSEMLNAAPDEVQAEKQRQVAHMRRDARSVFGALEGWQHVRTAEQWLAICQATRQDYQSGRFVIEQLGATRYLDPELMATLWGLRQGLVAGSRGTTAEAMLADLVVASYANTLKLQRWIGDLALATERELFGENGPTPRFEERHGHVEGLVIEDQMRRLGEELLPLLDRAKRMTIRTLKAFAELQRGPAPSVAIGQAGQVNLGHGAQLNVTPDADQHDDSAMPAAGVTKTKRSKH